MAQTILVMVRSRTNYNVTENVSIDFEALNITDEVLIQLNSLGINRGLEDVGKRFTLGVRAKF